MPHVQDLSHLAPAQAVTLMQQAGLLKRGKLEQFARQQLPPEVALQLLDIRRNSPLSLYWKGVVSFMVLIAAFSGGTYTARVPGVEFSASIPSLSEGVKRMHDIWSDKPFKQAAEGRDQRPQVQAEDRKTPTKARTAKSAAGDKGAKKPLGRKPPSKSKS